MASPWRRAHRLHYPPAAGHRLAQVPSGRESRTFRGRYNGSGALSSGWTQIALQHAIAAWRRCSRCARAKARGAANVWTSMPAAMSHLRPSRSDSAPAGAARLRLPALTFPRRVGSAGRLHARLRLRRKRR